MTAILGISAFYHDSAAALIVDGQVVAAAQEERFSRRKHDAAFPSSAIEYCLSAAGLKFEQLDYVAYYEKPITKFDRLIETHVAYAPWSYGAFRRAMPTWLAHKLPLTREIRRGLQNKYEHAIIFVDHHEAHAASAFFPAPFQEAAILTIDGVGEWSTTTIGHGRGNHVELIDELRFPHSLGLLYSAFTYYLGFRINSGEYKVMGLAPYGQPGYVDRILSELIDLKADGSFRLDMRYFDFGHRLRMTNDRFHRLFGGQPRPPESELTQRHMDIAASIQTVTDEIVLRLARQAQRLTGSQNLVMAGGVALNCVANSFILSQSDLQDLWIQPAAGDAGGALGAAWLVWFQLLEQPRSVELPDRQQGSLLGPCFDASQISQALDSRGAFYKRLDDEAELLDAIVDQLEQQQVVGWFQGRMEFGPRALGARSILADPRKPEMQTRLNEKIKRRESFRPFAPSVLVDQAHNCFQLPKVTESPYMMLTATAVPRHDEPPGQFASGASHTMASQLHSSLAGEPKCTSSLSHLPVRDGIMYPAVTHVDRSTRLQTVDASRNPRFHRLLRSWQQRTGCAVLLNTSFNVRGEPLVCTPIDAVRCFMATELDVLVIENFVLFKKQQPVSALLSEQTSPFPLD